MPEPRLRTREQEGDLPCGTRQGVLTFPPAGGAARPDDPSQELLVRGPARERALSRLRSGVVPGPAGRRVVRLLIPEACRHRCLDCPMGSPAAPGRRIAASRIARLFLVLYRAGQCDGLFLTVGVPGDPVRATAEMLDVVEELRLRLGFRGYFHVKVPLGAARRQVERLIWLVDRVSARLEGRCEKAVSDSGSGGADDSREEATRFLLDVQRTSALRAPGPLPAGSVSLLPPADRPARRDARGTGEKGGPRRARMAREGALGTYSPQGELFRNPLCGRGLGT